MKKTLVFGAVFLCLCGFLTFVAWMCGYNFDHRSPAVGFWTFSGTIFAAAISGCIAGERE